jgi:hypothetical protein
MEHRIERIAGEMPALFIRQIPEEIEDTVSSAAGKGFEHSPVRRGELGNIIAGGLRELAAKNCADLRIKLSGANAELAEVRDSKGRRPTGDDRDVWRLFIKE